MKIKKRTSLDSILNDSQQEVIVSPDALPTSKSSHIHRQTIYLPKPVYEQLRRLAFEERLKMHDYLLKGLDLVFQEKGLPLIADLTSSNNEV